MQPPIPVDTVLQNRYRVLKILGQGGFGRTYLAEDQGRFNELCALKELIPTQTGGALEKSQELFAREATILYQIQHPQVPQFRATFEQDKRLFLVQDYVAGKTYRTLLDERMAVGKTFSELEVSQFLRSLLPVLAQIHSRGIIHRDISPENIILRSSDQLPVLIDFGVVKELATRFQSSSPESVATTVGKLGYAPTEQIQTGRAYPSSDLYSLAVTSVVLLTGKEPQQLFDDNQLTWDWQRLTNVSPKFAQVINRMLSMKPGDRYQNANDVLEALSSAPLSNVNTIAIGRRPDPVIPNRPNIPQPRGSSIIDNPWAIGAIGTFVVLVAGIGSWMLVSTLRSQQTTAPAPKQAFPSPIVLGTPTATVTVPPIPTTTPTSSGRVNYSQNLELTSGVTTLAQDNLKGNATISFPFNGTQGQKLTVSLADEGVLLSVVGPNQRAIDKTATRVPSYEGILPFTGQYAIILRTVKGVSESNYKLSVRLDNSVTPTPGLETPGNSPLPPTPIPSLSPTPSPPTPAPNEEVKPPLNGTPIPVPGQTSSEQIKHYFVNVESGKQLAIAVKRGAVKFSIYDPSGKKVESELLSWRGKVSSPGSYQIEVLPTQPGRITPFTINVSVSNKSAETY